MLSQTFRILSMICMFCLYLDTDSVFVLSKYEILFPSLPILWPILNMGVP